MKKIILMTIACSFLLVSCKNKKEEMNDNPFFNASEAPFGAPEFDKIETVHYLPAFAEGMKRHNKEIKTVIENNDAADFKNTIVALDEAGEMLNWVSGVFFNLNSAITSPEMQAIADSISKLLSAHDDAISMSTPLFEKIQAVYNQRESLNLHGEDSMLLENTYLSFVRNGALLTDAQKEEMKKINERLSTLSLHFGQNVLSDNNGFKLLLSTEEEMAGIPENLRAAAAEAAKAEGKEGKYLFTLDWPSIFPFLTYSKNRELREKMYKGYTLRGNLGNDNDNNDLIVEMVNLRQQRASLLGYPSHAAFVLDRNMAKTPENVNSLLERMMPLALKRAGEELTQMQSIVKKEGGSFKLEPWDWWHYAEKLRKEKYDLNEEELRPYFVTENVRDGAFNVASKLYGIQFALRSDIPVYHQDVEVFEVLEDGKHLGLLYLDYYPRESKRGGAWCTSFRPQRIRNGEKITPLVSIVCNFSKPIGNKPSLLSVDETETFFHEFGHALHGLFNTTQYSGTRSVPRDFVELPSQINENWATEPEVMKSYARHFETGMPIPDQLIAKLEKSKLFNQGFISVEYLAASLLDMAYHTIETPMKTSAATFEQTFAQKINLIPEITYRYRSTYFTHIFSGGYSSGYYSYFWSEILDADAFEAFKEHGIFDQATANAFRKEVLSKGGSDEAMNLYKAFRGREPQLEPAMKRKGLI